MDNVTRKKHSIGYIIFFVVLVIDYFFVPTEHFFKVLWPLIVIFTVFEIYLFFSKPTQK